MKHEVIFSILATFVVLVGAACNSSSGRPGPPAVRPDQIADFNFLLRGELRRMPRIRRQGRSLDCSQRSNFPRDCRRCGDSSHGQQRSDWHADAGFRAKRRWNAHRPADRHSGAWSSFLGPARSSPRCESSTLCGADSGRAATRRPSVCNVLFRLSWPGRQGRHEGKFDRGPVLPLARKRSISPHDGDCRAARARRSGLARGRTRQTDVGAGSFGCRGLAVVATAHQCRPTEPHPGSNFLDERNSMTPHDEPAELRTPSASVPSEAGISRRAMLFKLGLLFNGLVAAMLAVPILGYILSPAIREKKDGYESWLSLGELEKFPAGETRLATYRNPVVVRGTGKQQISRAGFEMSMGRNSRSLRSIAHTLAARFAGFRSRAYSCAHAMGAPTTRMVRAPRALRCVDCLSTPTRSWMESSSSRPGNCRHRGRPRIVCRGGNHALDQECRRVARPAP